MTDIFPIDSYIKKMENLTIERNKFKQIIYNDKLIKLGIQENLETMQKPTLDKLDTIQESITNMPQPTIEYRKSQAIQQSPEEILQIKEMFESKENNLINENLSVSIKPAINAKGFLTIGGKVIQIENIEGKPFIYDPNNASNSFALTENIIKLIKGEKLEDFEDHDQKDYYKILNHLNVKGSKSTNRFKTLKEKFKRSSLRIKEIDGDTKVLSKNERDLFGSGLGKTSSLSPIIISDNKKELLDRLNILISARKEGHNSSSNEINAILKRLLEKKIINIEQFKLFSEARA